MAIFTVECVSNNIIADFFSEKTFFQKWEKFLLFGKTENFHQKRNWKKPLSSSFWKASLTNLVGGKNRQWWPAAWLHYGVIHILNVLNKLHSIRNSIQRFGRLLFCIHVSISGLVNFKMNWKTSQPQPSRQSRCTKLKMQGRLNIITRQYSTVPPNPSSFNTKHKGCN